MDAVQPALASAASTTDTYKKLDKESTNIVRMEISAMRHESGASDNV